MKCFQFIKHNRYIRNFELNIVKIFKEIAASEIREIKNTAVFQIVSIVFCSISATTWRRSSVRSQIGVALRTLVNDVFSAVDTIWNHSTWTKAEMNWIFIWRKSSRQWRSSTDHIIQRTPAKTWVIMLFSYSSLDTVDCLHWWQVVIVGSGPNNVCWLIITTATNEEFVLRTDESLPVAYFGTQFQNCTYVAAAPLHMVDLEADQTAAQEHEPVADVD